ncbi:hypothetical protein LLH23_06620 [bacterium]|nr:hypothetical protein [bacterium]
MVALILVILGLVHELVVPGVGRAQRGDIERIESRLKDIDRTISRLATDPQTREPETRPTQREIIAKARSHAPPSGATQALLDAVEEDILKSGVLITQGRLHGAEASLRNARRRLSELPAAAATQQGRYFLEAMLSLQHSSLLAFQGDMRGAAAMGASGLPAADNARDPMLRRLLLMQVASAEADCGQWDVAAEHAEEARRLGPDDARATVLSGVCYDMLSRPDLALRRFDTAIAQLFRGTSLEEPEATHLLATSYSNRAILQWRLGQLRDSKTDFDMAVAILQRMQKDGNDVRYELAHFVNNRGNILGNLGYALAAYLEHRRALKMQRALQSGAPSVMAPEIAMTLNDMGNTLTGLHLAVLAESRFGEAERMLLPLADSDEIGYGRELALVLYNRAECLNLTFRAKRALDCATRSVAIFKRLDAALPNCYLEDYANALSVRAHALWMLNRDGEAADASGDAVAVRRRLASLNEHLHRHGLAIALNNQAVVLEACGRWEEAKDAAKESDQVLRSLMTDTPGAYRSEAIAFWMARRAMAVRHWVRGVLGAIWPW